MECTKPTSWSLAPLPETRQTVCARHDQGENSVLLRSPSEGQKTRYACSEKPPRSSEIRIRPCLVHELLWAATSQSKAATRLRARRFSAQYAELRRPFAAVCLRKACSCLPTMFSCSKRAANLRTRAKARFLFWSHQPAIQYYIRSHSPFLNKINAPV